MGKNIVDRFPRVFFEMSTGNTNREQCSIFQRYFKNSLADDGRKKLADLISLWQVRIEIVLAVKNGSLADAGADTQTKFDRVADSFPVQYRQHARHAQIHCICLLIRGGAKLG